MLREISQDLRLDDHPGLHGQAGEDVQPQRIAAGSTEVHQMHVSIHVSLDPAAAAATRSRLTIPNQEFEIFDPLQHSGRLHILHLDRLRAGGCQVARHLFKELIDHASLYRLLGAVHTTFDLFESVRAIIDVSAASAVETPPSTPVLRVRHMEFSNPLELLVLGAVGVVVGVAHLVQRVADATAKVQEISHATKAERRRAELHPLEKQSMQLDNLKKAIELAPLLEALNPSISHVLGVEIPQPDSRTLPRLEALKDQAIEAAVELQASSNEPIALTAGEPSDTTSEDADSGHDD
jgi:hypothetical protein